MKKIVLILTAAIAITGCSSTQMAVQWADTFLSWQINDAFDLTSSQKKAVRKEIESSIASLRKGMFPKYASFLRSAKEELQGIHSAEQAQSFVPEKASKIERLLKETFLQVEPQILAAASQIEIKNWQEFKEDFRDRTEEILRGSKDNKSKLRSRLSDWVGSLSSEQKDKVDKFIASTPSPQEERAKNRQYMLESFEKRAEIKATAFDKNTFKIAVSDLIKNYENLRSESYVKSTEEYRKNLYTFLADFYLSLSPKQKNLLMTNIEKRAKDLESLSL